MKLKLVNKIMAQHQTLTTEMLILPDGKILAHNITPVMAAVLSGLNPADQPMKCRAAPPTAQAPRFPQ
jgi:hypothetical protein